jgi:glycosyl-4,4'-diaponeurosporenoate acyltransferase
MLDVPFRTALICDIALCCLWSGVVAGWSVRAPLSAAPAGRLTRLRPWEQDGRIYARLGVGRWKRHLPDVGPRLGGEAKRLGGRRGRADLERFVALTRRAETAHWLMLLVLPVDGVIRSGWVLVPMVGAGLIANGPCIVVQRYNRARLETLLAKAAARHERWARASERLGVLVPTTGET